MSAAGLLPGSAALPATHELAGPLGFEKRDTNVVSLTQHGHAHLVTPLYWLVKGYFEVQHVMLHERLHASRSMVVCDSILGLASHVRTNDMHINGTRVQLIWTQLVHRCPQPDRILGLFFLLKVQLTFKI